MLSNFSLAGRNLGARDSVACEAVVDVGSVAGIGCLDVSRDLSSGCKSLRSTTSDLDLSARNVELRGRAGVVNSKLLDTEQVLASSNAGGDCDGVVVCLCVS